MTTRRPRMPRAGNGAPRPPRPADANDAAASRNARTDGVPGRPAEGRPASGKPAAGREPAGGRPAAGSTSRAGSTRPQASKTQQSPSRNSGAKPAQPGTSKPAASKSGTSKPGQSRPSRAAGAPAVLRLPKSEARLRQRAELSGAIRSGRPGPAASEAEAAPAGQHGAAPVPARSFSGRLIALAVVLAAVTALLLPSVGVYMEQRKELTALQETIASLEAEQEHLQTQIKRWEDPAYIRQQARERINLVMPGERKYMVVGEPPETAGEPLPENASPADVPADLPWVDALWDSVKRAATD